MRVISFGGGFDVVGSGLRFRGSRLSWLSAVPCRLVSFGLSRWNIE